PPTPPGPRDKRPPADWKEVRSAEGGFTIWMPGIPTEGKTPGNVPPGTTSTMFTVKDDKTGVTFTLNYTKYANLIFPQPKLALDTARDAGLAPVKGQLVGDKDITPGN